MEYKKNKTFIIKPNTKTKTKTKTRVEGKGLTNAIEKKVDNIYFEFW